MGGATGDYLASLSSTFQNTKCLQGLPHSMSLSAAEMEKPRVLWREREILEPEESTVIPLLTQTRKPEDFTHRFLKRAHHVCLEHCKSQRVVISYSDVTSPSTWTALVLVCSHSDYFIGTVVSRSPKHRKKLLYAMQWTKEKRQSLP